MEATTQDSIDVVVVGDVHIDRESPATTFQAVRELFADADLVFGNLEGALSNDGELLETNRGHALRSPPEMIEGIDVAGFDVLSLANNHAMDFGPDALVDTIERLNARDIDVAGAGRDREAAESVVVAEATGFRVGMIAFEATDLTWHDTEATPDRAGLNFVKVCPHYPKPYISDRDIDRVREQAERASEGVDCLLAMVHAGESIDPTITVQQRALARTLVDAGVDIVVGHHPHTIQAATVLDGVPVFHSLGNFVFDGLPIMQRLDRARRSGIVRLRIGPNGVESARFYPVEIDENGDPRLADAARDSQAFAAIDALSMREGTALGEAEDSFVLPLSES